jgi:hypothetical protein
MSAQLGSLHSSSEQGRKQSNEDGNAPKRPACSECRRKVFPWVYCSPLTQFQKIRCIGSGEPPCQNCLEAGVECIYVEGKKRGPAKGYFDVITKRFLGNFEC